MVKEFYINELLQLQDSDMPRLEDLKVSLLNQTPEQLRERIRKIREERIIRKDKPKNKAQKAERKSKIQTDLAKLLASMSDEDREAFLKELEG